MKSSQKQRNCTVNKKKLKTRNDLFNLKFVKIIEIIENV